MEFMPNHAPQVVLALPGTVGLLGLTGKGRVRAEGTVWVMTVRTWFDEKTTSIGRPRDANCQWKSAVRGCC